MSPLAELLRPQKLEDIVGQEHLLDQNGLIKTSLKQKKPQSFILWGPPGCGKTTLARLYAKAFDARFASLSGVFGTTAEIKKIIGESESRPLFSSQIILFVDEIHRFNKAQQDAFLPYIENGFLVLVGATTENPSFCLNNALLSRLRVLTMNSLKEDDLEKILIRYETIYKPLELNCVLRSEIKKLSQGDGRYLLNLVESLRLSTSKPENVSELYLLLQKKSALFDKEGDNHFNLISAFHKSIRGSDPDAGLYWLSRMLEGGQDPLYIVRRLIRMASEDIGLADPQALIIALKAKEAFEALGSPEGDLALAQAAVYLALAPKSNALYKAYNQSRQHASATTHLPPPLKLLNCVNKTLKDLGWGNGYKYDHDEPYCFSGQNYFPDLLERQSFYKPKERGFEREMIKRMDYFEGLRKKINN